MRGEVTEQDARVVPTCGSTAFDQAGRETGTTFSQVSSRIFHSAGLLPGGILLETVQVSSVAMTSSVPSV